MNNLLSYCGLVDVRINAPDKDLPVCSTYGHPVHKIGTKSNFLPWAGRNYAERKRLWKKIAGRLTSRKLEKYIAQSFC